MRTYHQGDTNHCPGCGRSQWLIGRVTAECAFCHTALPLPDTSTGRLNRPVVVRHDNTVWENAA